MVATPLELRALTHELTVSTWTLTALAVLLETGLVEHLREPRSIDELSGHCPTLSRGRIERVLGVAAAAGLASVEGDRYRLAEGAMPFSQQPMRAALLGDIRSTLMQSLAFLDSSTEKGVAPGWHHTNRTLLQAQGDGSAMFPPMFKANIVPTLGDLAARLDRPGARFLDVGVGVASLTIAMCRAWPSLQVVGLDVFDVPLALARENVARADLGDRVELRKLSVEELSEEGTFDLAWLPSVFIPATVLPSAVARVRASLRPGGFLIFPVMG